MIDCNIKMQVLSFWCCTSFALQPLHCLQVSWIIESRNNYEICETAAEICSESVKNYEYVFQCELNALCHLWDQLQLCGHTY